MQETHNAIAHHPPIDTQLILSGDPPTPTPPTLYTRHDVTWYGIFLWPVWVSYPDCVPSQLLVPLQPSCWLGRRS